MCVYNERVGIIPVISGYRRVYLTPAGGGVGLHKDHRWTKADKAMLSLGCGLLLLLLLLLLALLPLEWHELRFVYVGSYA